MVIFWWGTNRVPGSLSLPSGGFSLGKKQSPPDGKLLSDVLITHFSGRASVVPFSHGCSWYGKMGTGCLLCHWHTCVLQFCNKLHAVGTHAWVTGGLWISISLTAQLYWTYTNLCKENLLFYLLLLAVYYCRKSKGSLSQQLPSWIPPFTCRAASSRCRLQMLGLVNEMSDHCSSPKRSSSAINTWTWLRSSHLSGVSHAASSWTLNDVANLYNNFHLKVKNTNSGTVSSCAMAISSLYPQVNVAVQIKFQIYN